MHKAALPNKISRLIMIASSTGGPRVLRQIFEDIGQLDATILITQHIAVNADKLLRDNLQKLSGMEVILPLENEMAQNGRIYIAECDHHMLLDRQMKFHIDDGQMVNFVRPSADVMMMSAIPSPGMKILGIILTGIGRDGTDGLRYLKSIGGKVIAQNPETCIIHEMPSNAIASGCVDAVMNIEDIKRTLIRFAKPAALAQSAS